ncbi:MAG: hypothetical protein HY675_22755 [Chloroflexi bacterium]|nr:hypothetical protein [Chloroflexota bacterium]
MTPSAIRTRKTSLSNLQVFTIWGKRMYNKTIAALEAMDSASGFERLSSTLLFPIYPNINPIGGAGDRGRDATGQIGQAIDSNLGRIVFQFSYQKDWERKLKAELRKTKENSLDPVRYVFVSSRRVAGESRDKYEKWVRQTYGWELEIYDQEWLRARLESPEYLNLRQDYLGLRPDTIPLFMSPEEFVARQGNKALGTLDLPLLGRQGDLETLSEWLQGEAPVLILHAPGGVGKTKLCVEFARQVQAAGHWTTVFVRTEAEEFESHIPELLPGQPYLVVVDDAHRFDHLKRFGELLSNASIGRIKLLLNTRPVFKDLVTHFAVGYEVHSLELRALGRADVDKLLISPPFDIANAAARHIILSIADGNPLIAQLAARLVVAGKEISDLNADSVLQRYLDDVISQVLVQDEQKGRSFLAVLVGLGGIEASEQGLWEAIRVNLGLSAMEEQQLMARLLSAGIVHRGFSRLRIVPDTLAGHVLLHWFFDPSTRLYDFRSFILDPYLTFKGADILRNLAEAEFRGESRLAGALLSDILQQIADFVGEANNAQRNTVLRWVAEFGALRPDDALYIVSKVIAGPEMPPTQVNDPHWGSFTVEHELVLAKAVTILKQTKYERVADSLRFLYELSTYQVPAESYRHVRHDAVESIKDFFRLDPRKPIRVYEEGIRQIRQWLRDDAGSEGLSVELLGELLKVDVDWAELSPADNRTVTIHREHIRPIPWLGELRRNVFATLFDLYERTSSAVIRKRIIDTCRQLVVYSPRRPDPPLQGFLNREIKESMDFFNDRIDQGAELYERFHIWAWAKSVKRHGGYVDSDLIDLIARIENDPKHELYRYLANHTGYYDDDRDWRASEEKQKNLIQKQFDAVDEGSIDLFIDCLEEIVANALKIQNHDLPGVRPLLFRFGLQKPDLADRLLKRVGPERLELRFVTDSALAGLRQNSPPTALNMADRWISGNDPVLHRAVALSYYRFQGPVSEADLEILERLSLIGDSELLGIVVRALPVCQRANAGRTVDLLRRIADGADDWVLTCVADIIAFHGSDGDGTFHILEIAPNDFRRLVWNFARMTRLDKYRAYDVDEALRRFGQVDPLGLLQFLRYRVEQHEMKASDKDYEPLPHEFHYAFAGLEKRDDYADLLREVRGWMLDSNGKMNRLTIEGASILKQLCQGTINDKMREVLSEWIEGSVEQQRAVAHILREFSDQDRFHELAKQLLARTDDNIVQAHLRDATFSTGVQWGSLVPYYSGQMRAYQSWLDDATTPLKARLFAKKMVDRLLSIIEGEELREAEEGV